MSKINNIATIIIAGGKSSRMGRPKGLIQIGSKSLLQEHIDTFTEVSSQIVVVLGHHVKEYTELRDHNPNVLFLINKEYENGPFSSIKKGFTEVHSHFTFILPVDNAPLKIETIKRLLLESHSELSVVKPTYNNKAGHPILLSSEIQKLILDKPLNSRLDNILRSIDLNKIKWHEVDDKNVGININTPEILSKILE